MPSQDSRSRSWLVAAGLVASVPALGVGFTFDDLIHRLRLEGRFDGLPPSVLGLYEFTDGAASTAALMARGAFPWFTYPGIAMRFFRPLSSASLALDHALFGRASFVAHLHSLVWFGLLVAFVGALHARWLHPRAARLATLLYAVAGVHAIPTAWLSSRHTLLAATFSVVALWAWARFREERWRFGVPLTAIALGLSLLASEAWLAGLLFLVLYEWARGRGWRARLTGIGPFAGVGVCYVLVYSALGYGVRGSAMYVSPLQAPGEYLRLSFTRVPLAYAELFGGVPSILTSASPRLELALVAWGLFTLLLATGTFLTQRAESNALRSNLLWLGAGAALSPFLLVGTSVTGRVLPVPLLGASAVLAAALVGAREAIRSGPVRRRGLAAVALAVLGATSLLLSPLSRVALSFVFWESAQAHERVAREADLGPCARGGSIYVLDASDPALSLYLGPSLLYYTPEKAHAERVRVLLAAPHAVRFTRVSDRAFELELIGTPRRTNDFEILYRPSTAPLVPGLSVKVEELRATVLDAAAGLATKVRFELAESLDGPTHCFVAWRDGRVQPVAPPAPRQSLTLPHELGPTGL